MGEKFTRRVTYRDVPVHRWGAYSPANRQTDMAGKMNRTEGCDRVMVKVGELMAAGAAVTLTHRVVNPAWVLGEPYDVIDVEATFL